MTWLYKIAIGGFFLLSVYLIYTNYTLNRKVSVLKESIVEAETIAIKNREYLIDSLQKSKILITKEILQNDKNIQKIKAELNKTNSPMTLEEARKLLGL